MQSGRRRITLADAEEAVQQRALAYDKSGDNHYDTISAFIKSMRGSDPDAAVYWLARMIQAGEDPRFIARRMVIHAAEDVGHGRPAWRCWWRRRRRRPWSSSACRRRRSR